MREPVKFVQTHTPIFVPGTGQLKANIQVSDYTGMVMFYTREGVEANYKGVSFIIPLGNLGCAVFVNPTFVLSETPKVSLVPAGPRGGVSLK